MTTKTPPPPPKGPTPHLVCAGAADAIAFYETAFGARELFRGDLPDGKVMHAVLDIGGGQIFLVDEMPRWGVVGPKALGGSPVTIHLNVADVDAAFDRAVAAGATAKMPVADMFWGDRYGILEDPFGHRWSMATRQRDMSTAEIAEAMKAASGGCG